MKRILLILSIFALDYDNCSAQANDIKFNRMRISHNSDSPIKQEYELVIKSKKVYFITPFASYLHIKGGKYRTRVKFVKSKREEVFNLVDRLIWTNIEQVNHKEIKNKYFVVEIYSSDNLIRTFKVSADLLPSGFKELYDTLTGDKCC
jgi:hypothetical protein